MTKLEMEKVIKEQRERLDFYEEQMGIHIRHKAEEKRQKEAYLKVVDDFRNRIKEFSGLVVHGEEIELKLRAHITVQNSGFLQKKSYIKLEFTKENWPEWMKEISVVAYVSGEAEKFPEIMPLVKKINEAQDRMTLIFDYVKKALAEEGVTHNDANQVFSDVFNGK